MLMHGRELCTIVPGANLCSTYLFRAAVAGPKLSSGSIQPYFLAPLACMNGIVTGAKRSCIAVMHLEVRKYRTLAWEFNCNKSPP